MITNTKPMDNTIESDAAFATRELDLNELDAVAGGSADGPSPVLMVISNQDFWYQDYADTRI